MTLILLLTTCLAADVDAQQVYRCQLADGSTIFSDLPCRSDIGEADRVDATPHQGHRRSSQTGAPAYRMSAGSDDGSSPNRSGSGNARGGRALSRNERLSLERKRKKLLSGLKRRHLEPERRKTMIGELREVDEKLGIDSGDVADMPFHNREVYEDHPIFRR
ncbi:MULTISPECIES: DUF4124 domain-containing protein [unclassified Wenzhouxiangella]|uniref:DUF4124 domain-containing protein n=1 Tax=unclassified Wenzhouxiangella TaxID=2613841 RepID=UPI0015F251A2|nr:MULTISPECIES: DUF4124 domain-containing protein [unclassified Wenzhouxiangella]